jgi:hypothetical protein
MGSTTVTGNGTYVSSPATLTSVGRYCWYAEFSGDELAGVPPASDGTIESEAGTGECFEVLPVTPAITTNASGPVEIGNAISDTAELTGTASFPGIPVINPTSLGADATGTITFNLYGPFDDTVTCDGDPVFTDTVNVSGNGAYSSADYTPTAAGTYNWIASYSGDDPNTLPVSGECGDANEASVVIQLQPTMDTAQEFVPNDSATITVVDPIGGDLTGTVVFELFVDDALCVGDADGNADYTSDPIDITTGVGDGLSQTVMSANTVAYTTSSRFDWVVTYTSANPAHEDVTSACGNETSFITIDNGKQQPEPPPT